MRRQSRRGHPLTQGILRPDAYLGPFAGIDTPNMFWIAAVIVAWVTIDAIVVVVMAHLAASRRTASAAALPPLRAAPAHAENTPGPLK